MKQLFLISIAFILLVSTAGCRTQRSEHRTITVSIQPQAYFLERLAGNKFSIHVMVPTGSSPESYDPSPSQIVELSKSEAYFWVGSLGFELAWKEKIGSNNPKLKMYDNSVGIETIADGHVCSNPAHHHEHSDEHEVASGVDPHIWSSPKTVLTMIRNMYDALLELDPDNKEYYTERYDSLKAELEEIDRQFIAKFEKLKDKAFLIYHPSLGYLAKDYGLMQLPIELEGKEPTPKHLARLTQVAREHRVKVIFIQPEFDKKNAQVLSETLGIPTVPINPLAYEWEQELNVIVDALCR